MEEENKIELGPSCLDGITAIQVWTGKNIIIGLNSTCEKWRSFEETWNALYTMYWPGVIGTDPKCQKFPVKFISGYC